MRDRRAAAVPGVLIALIVLTGCTGQSDAPSVPPEVAPSSARSDEGGTELEEPLPRGPLDALLDAVRQVGAETPEAQLARLERSEEIVTACMTEQGFEYEPADWGAIMQEQWALEARMQSAEPWRPADGVEYAREHGYGITTSGTADEPAETTGGVVMDPNAERVSQMSRAQAQAWDLALYGPGQGVEYLDGTEPYDWTKHGCLGVSDHELGIDTREFFDDSAWSDLRNEIEALEMAVAVDPRLAEAREGWSTCMASAGYPGYADPGDPMREISDRSTQIWEQVGTGVQLDLSTDDYLTDPAYLAQQAELARLEAEVAPLEIALAVADATCRVEVDYDRRHAQTRLALQEEFYEAHRVDLDAWLAAAQEFDAAQR